MFLTEIIIHEEYDPSSLGINDICLIKVGTPFVFDDAVAPCTLPEQDEAPEGNEINITNQLSTIYVFDPQLEFLAILNIWIFYF